MIWTVPRCYDSHTHLLATGILQSGLRLFELKSEDDVGKIKLEPQHFRGEWLVGFGWDQSKWPGMRFPTKETLDRYFPDFPVALSRADGHAVWLNSRALEKAGYLNKSEKEKPAPPGGVILRDPKGYPTGVFTELAKLEIDFLIPPYTDQQNREFIRAAMKYFNVRGFSHIRDMSGFLKQWNLLREMDLSGELSLYVEENFTCENLKDFDRALSEAILAQESQTRHLRARGIKFYFDGALGSQGALLSQFYQGTTEKGVALWDLGDVEEVIERTWRAGLEVCVHTIGDEAAHVILKTAQKVTRERNVQGLLNVEHSEIVRPETIELMKNLSVVCHIQPCHWLTDRRWLKEKLGTLYVHAFPWASLQKNGITIQWGSDSPIEEASVENNYRALIESPHFGISQIEGEPLAFQSHREKHWGAQCHTVFKNGQLDQFIFDGQDLTGGLAIER